MLQAGSGRCITAEQFPKSGPCRDGLFTNYFIFSQILFKFRRYNDSMKIKQLQKERCNMTTYDWNNGDLFENSEQPKPEENPSVPQPNAEQVRQDDHVQKQQPASATWTQPEYAARAGQDAAESGYPHFEYSSGPAFTARPAQDERTQAWTRTPQMPEKKVKTRSGGFGKKAVALVLACTLLGGGAGVGGALLVNRLQHGGAETGKPSADGSHVYVATPRETANLNVITVERGKLMTASEVYQANVNSTVGITTEITTTNWWGYQSTSAAAGSGFILTEDGYILTNQHVIENANTITVAMFDGTTYPAKLVGYDTSNDIAVLKIEAKDLVPVTLGDSDHLLVGDEVVAIGNPLGELTFSLTKGNVSALDRAVTLSRNVTMDLIQTDAAINSGNSGGALFNMYGEVVGITNAKYSSSGYTGQASIDNIGFAIPINSVREIVTSIIEKGYISRPYIGVSVSNVSEESQSYGMPKGAAIRAVEQGGPAEQAGLQANDIVTALNGEAVTSYEDFAKRVAASEIGAELKLTVYRRGETLELTVTVGEKTQDAIPSDDGSQPQSQDPRNGGSEGNGFHGGGEGSDDWGGDPFSWGFPFGWSFGG